MADPKWRRGARPLASTSSSEPWSSSTRFLKLLVPCLLVALVAIVSVVTGWDDLATQPSAARVIGASAFLGFLAAAAYFIRFVFLGRIAQDLIYFAAETAHEAGPAEADIHEAQTGFLGMARVYRESRLSGVYRLFALLLVVPHSEVERLLARIETQLSNGIGIDRVHALAGTILRFCESTREVYGGGLIRLSTRIVGSPSQIISRAEESIRDFSRAVQEFQAADQHGRLRYAKLACLRSRRAGFFVHCLGAQVCEAINSQLLGSFVSDLTVCAGAMKSLAGTYCGVEKQAIAQYCASLERRIAALRAQKSSDISQLWFMLESAARGNT